MTGAIQVDFHSLTATADELQRLSLVLADLAPTLAAEVTIAGLPGLVPYGLLEGVSLSADLLSLFLPGATDSIPDVAAELLALSLAVRAAATAYQLADTTQALRAELPSAEALLLLAAWNRLHELVNATALATGQTQPVRGPAGWLDSFGESLLDHGDRWIEGGGSVHEIDPADMPALSATPAANLASLLDVVNTISDVHHPATAALVRVGDNPPRYVLCLPGLQDPTQADSSAADLPGAIATLTGHSAYIRGMRHVLAGLPAGSQVLLVGHSQGGMVAEALATAKHLGSTTIAGVLTAGAPLLATSVQATVPYLALENTDDPVPDLGALASSHTGGSLTRPASSGQRLVRFSTPGDLPSIAKHGLGSGGYIAEAGSANPAVAAFARSVKGLFTTAPVSIRYLQVTDSDGTLTR